MSQGFETLRSVLADRYAIERELGRGASAVVYLAHDRKHDRKVAVKVLLPEVALAVRAERFLREISIAAKLNHPHILPVLDSGNVDGVLYYVMPCMEGESVRDRLRREKQLSIEDAIRIAREVAEALSYAHGKGVVHRDIKPENILLQAGQAVVADFGIARALTVTGGETVTETGVAVGTPAYMSPEQAGATEAVDARSDVYSLGCVLYEMLAGHPPFTGATAQEVLARHALDTVPTVRAARHAVSESTDGAIRRALAKQPADRFPSTAAFAAAIGSNGPAVPVRRRPSRVATATAGLTLAGILLVMWLTGRGGADDRSVGVLSCVPLVTDAGDEYLGQGMADELITALSRVPGLRVPALTSSLAVKGKDLPVRQVAEALEVATVLECTVRRVGNRIRVRARLVRGENGSQLWSNTYDRELKNVSDLVGVQEDIARAIVGALPWKMIVPSASFAARHTPDTAAYDRYLQGHHFYRRRTAADLTRAIEYFEEAIRRDSAFALAYSGLADVYLTSGASGFQPRSRVYQRARDAALKAVALDDELAEAHAALAQVHYWVEWDWDAARRELARALALNPNLSEAHVVYGQLLSILGHFDEAAREAELARRLDPLSPGVSIGSTFLFARRYDDAIREYQRVALLAPDYPTPYGNLGRAYINAGRFLEAIPPLEKARALRGRPNGQLAFAYAKAGRRDDALKVLSEIEGRGPATSEEARQGLAWAYLGLGDKDRAVDAIITAVRARQVNPGFVAEPVWDVVRSDPRIQEMRRGLGLKP